jgi:2-phospho-L-lactate guanylyltransferase
MMIDASSSSSIAIAGDRRGTGTNALLLRPPKLIAYAYGEKSVAAHARAANAVQAAVSLVARLGLQFDIDTPEDWHAWQALKKEREHRRRGVA